MGSYGVNKLQPVGFLNIKSVLHTSVQHRTVRFGLIGGSDSNKFEKVFEILSQAFEKKKANYFTIIELQFMGLFDYESI